MPSKDEKARRKELLQSLRNEGRQKTRDGFPVPLLMLKGLFDSLDVKLSETDCDDTLRFAREFIQRNALDEKLVIAWLEEHGGCCDCEALNNVEEIVADAVRFYERIGAETDSVN